MNSEIIKKFCDLLGEERVFTGEAMSRHTTFKIGGPADYFLMPDKDTDVGRIVKICKESAIPYFILGNGSNLLVGDGGYRGAVIQIYKNMSAVTVEGTEITVQAGALLSSVAAAAKNAALTGFEFAGGIPGTMGGAVVMNAGAYGGEMKDVLIKKGMKILVELSKGLEEPDTAEMYREVYFHHDELCEKFIEKTGIVVTGFDEENIDRWFEVIEERTAILKQGDYEDAKEELMEIAAFLGNQLVKYLGGRWFHYLSENHESCGVEGCKTLNPGLNCLSVVVGGYTQNGMNWVKKSILNRYQKRKI